MIVREARQRYFDANGLTESEYRSGSFQVRIGPIPLSIPNTKARVRAVMLHDLHHVATGYDTTWRGEAEIGAWELAGGCGRHWVAWLAKLSVVAIGIAIAPRRTHRAFARGRSCDNLFRREFGEDLLGLTVAELRRGIGLSTQP
jgi:ubiquinone biosynthesis protein Coq4